MAPQRHRIQQETQDPPSKNKEPLRSPGSRVRGQPRTPPKLDSMPRPGHRACGDTTEPSYTTVTSHCVPNLPTATSHCVPNLPVATSHSVPNPQNHHPVSPTSPLPPAGVPSWLLSQALCHLLSSQTWAQKARHKSRKWSRVTGPTSQHQTLQEEPGQHLQPLRVSAGIRVKVRTRSPVPSRKVRIKASSAECTPFPRLQLGQPAHLQVTAGIA